MEVVVVLVRQTACPELICDLVPPRVLAPLPLSQLDHSLKLFPHEPLSCVDHGIRWFAGIMRSDPQVMRDPGKVPTLRRGELLEVTDGDGVHPSKGPCLAIAVLPCVGSGLDLPQPLIDHGHKIGRHQADFIDENPAPVSHALGNLQADGLVEVARVQANGVVYGLAIQVGSVGGLERDEFVVDAFLLARHLKELCEELDNVGLPSSRWPVQKVSQRLPALCPQRLFRLDQP